MVSLGAMLPFKREEDTGGFGKEIFQRRAQAHLELWDVGDKVRGRDKTEKTKKWQCREEKVRGRLNQGKTFFSTHGQAV